MKNIIKENKYKIQSIIKRFVGTPNEDLEQEIFLRIWRRLDTYKEKNKFSQWISTVASNVCKDFLKSKDYKTSSSQISDEDVISNIKSSDYPEKILDTKLRQRLILKAVDNLPKKLKQVVILYEFEGKSYEQIAQKLRVPEGTIKSRLYNARKVLMEQLRELIGD
ncbi:sigma-70 family RNA polymerase sigma factor [bacterium]|nr:sigma-70 family RNA polymerase sigma factor [bacterium]